MEYTVEYFRQMSDEFENRYLELEAQRIAIEEKFKKLRKVMSRTDPVSLLVQKQLLIEIDRDQKKFNEDANTLNHELNAHILYMATYGIPSED